KMNDNHLAILECRPDAGLVLRLQLEGENPILHRLLPELLPVIDIPRQPATAILRQASSYSRFTPHQCFHLAETLEIAFGNAPDLGLRTAEQRRIAIHRLPLIAILDQRPGRPPGMHIPGNVVVQIYETREDKAISIDLGRTLRD